METPKKVPSNLTICPSCKEAFYTWPSEIKRRPTCSRKCSSIKRTASSLLRWSNPNNREEQSKRLNKYFSNPEARTKVSDGLKSAISLGTYHPHRNYGKKSSIITKKAGVVHCNSSWEETFARYLDNDPLVISFQKDKIRIRYILEGKVRVYIVDFLVTHSKYGNFVVEIKPKEFLGTNENIAKFQEARRWSLNNLTPFLILTQDALYKIRNSNPQPSIKGLGILL